MGRKEIYNNIFGSNALFVTGLLIIPAFLFNPSAEYRVIFFLFFMFLAWLSGKKINFIFTALVTLSIIFFNLLIPYGRVLYIIGPLKITSGALEAGIHRAVTLQALVMLSKVTIRQDLKLPGAFGELLCDSLIIFSEIFNKKHLITKKNLIHKIDALLFELSANEQPAASFTAVKTKPAGYIILAAVMIISWFPWLIN